MRTAVLVIVFGLAGCAKPKPAEVPAVVIAPAGVGVPEPPAAIAPEVAVAPAPREVRDDPERASRMEWFRNHEEPLLRALARGEIKAGDDIGPSIERFPHCDVMRHGRYINLSISKGFGGTRVISKDGKLVLGSTSGCIYYDEFFNTFTDEERNDWSNSSSAMREQQHNFRNTLPAVAGLPAWFVAWHRPSRWTLAPVAPVAPAVPPLADGLIPPPREIGGKP